MAKQKAENPFGGVNTSPPPSQGEGTSGPNSTFNAAIALVKAQVGQQQETSGEAVQQSANVKAEGEPQPIRVNRGYKLREDLIKECKRIAIDDDKHLYDVMEEALTEYIERRRSQVTTS